MRLTTLSPRARRTSLRAVFALAVLAVAVGIGAGCAGWKGQLPQEEGLHPRLTRFTYLERGNLVAFAVDVSATILREESPYIPIGIGLANKGLERIKLDRESFTLVDEQGRRYPMASVAEVREKMSSLMRMDLRVSGSFAEVFAGSYDSWIQIPSVYFPVQDAGPSSLFGRRGLVIDRLEVPRATYMVDVIYFPRPEGPLKEARFELWLDSESLEQPFFVKFAVK